MIDPCYKKVLVLHFRHVGFFDIIIDFSGICKVFYWGCVAGWVVCVIFSILFFFFCGFVNFFL